MGGVFSLVFDRGDMHDRAHAQVNPLKPEPLLRNVFTATENMKVGGACLCQFYDTGIFEGSEFCANALHKFFQSVFHMPRCIFGIRPFPCANGKGHLSFWIGVLKFVYPVAAFARAARRAVP
ncbi:hypothetical protein ES705_43598 [subsurface metagenome]